jgi:signal transduction histidine kinase
VLGRLLMLGFLLAVVAAGCSFGIFRTVRTVYLSTLEERARLAESEREERARRAVLDERARIAREMHDVVAHSLSVIVSQAQGGAYVAASRPERAVQALETIAETGREALADMRGLLGVLRADRTGPLGADPTTPAAAGIRPAAPAEPQPALADLPDLIARVRAAGVPVELAGSGTPRRLGPATALAVYRLVQESLTNTLKHAGPDARADVRLVWTEEELTVTVTDDGYGQTPGPGGGQGLAGMRERAAVVGGQVSAGPRADRGFAVEARFPVGRS